jgi:succinyl-CoA synthetase alpha subunit
MDYGTNVVAGVTPGKGGQMFDGKVPVFDTVWEARRETSCNASMVFVPLRLLLIQFLRPWMQE